MELSEALRTTGSSRDFTDQPVDDVTVAAVLDDARFAPSGGNRQPWKVAVVSNMSIRRRLADLMTDVWYEYLGEGADPSRAPFAFGRSTGASPVSAPNPLLDKIENVPVVLAVAANFNSIALMDGNLDRPPITGGASVYPFCWSILLAARARGLGGVMTTFLSRAEAQAASVLGLPTDHALAATIFLGYPMHLNTKLRRGQVSAFTTIDRFDGEPLI
ncbi:MAG: nitroreductase family protein [Ilumatobacteraceae bacterium]